MKATQENLIKLASKTDKIVKAGNWSAQRHHTRPQIITVWHYVTAMFQYDVVQRNVIPLSVGRGSASDKQGVKKILACAGYHTSYKEIYGE